MPRVPTSSFKMYARQYPLAQQSLLTELRRVILAAEPGLTECTSYGLPAFALEGKAILAIGGASRHCALYPMSGRTLAAFAEPLAKFSTSKGTIRFELNRRVPGVLIRRIVKHRIGEFKSRGSAGASPRSGTRKTAIGSKRASEPSPAAAANRLSTAVTELLDDRHLENVKTIHSLRCAILKADPRIVEAIKWNAPSYRLDEFFATIHLRAPAGSLQIVLHRGAARVAQSSREVALAAPSLKTCTLRWPDQNRCIVTLHVTPKGNLPRTSLTTVTSLITQWIKRP